MVKTNFRPFRLGLLMGLALLLAMCALPEGALAEGDGGAEGPEIVPQSISTNAIEDACNKYSFRSGYYWLSTYKTGSDSTGTYCDEGYVAKSYLPSNGVEYKFDGAYQCQGFARFLAYAVTGYSYRASHWGSFALTGSTSLQPGDVVFAPGAPHAAVVYSGSGTSVTYIECWGGSHNKLNIGRFNGRYSSCSEILSAYGHATVYRYNGDIGGSTTPTNQDPQGFLDVIDGGTGTIHVRGWTFDSDDVTNSIWVHVYANNQYVGRALANQSRQDVDAAYHVGEFHGFDVTLPTTITGSVHVTVYAINTPMTPGNPAIGQKDVTIAACDHSWQDYYEATDVTHTKGSRCPTCGLTQDVTTGIPHTFVRQGGKYVCSGCGAEEASFPVTDVPSGQYVICAAGDNGLCLDVYGISMDNAANVQLCTVNGGKNQLFSIRRAGTDGAVRIQAMHSGMYLDVIGSGKASGTNVVQGASLVDNELWYPERTADGHYAFRSKANNLYLDIAGANLASGTNIQAWMGNGSVAQKFDLVRKQDTITRLSGANALDTMSAIVSAGFAGTGGTAVLCTSGGYWDALTAAGVAGCSSAPVLLTDGSSLSPQAIDCLARLRPATVVVCGGPGAVSETAASQAAAAAGGARVVRLWGDGATDTANDAYLSGASKLGCTWSDTAIVATDDGYWDALAAAPYAYWAHCPIFLADGHDRLTDATVSAMRSGGITKAIIVGGEKAVSSGVERQLGSAGITVDRRLWGDNAVQTSAAIASFEMTQGMSAVGMAVATTDGYWDALSGAALCGSRGSVLVLASDSDRRAVDQVAGANVAGITSAYVFGGEMAVSASTYDYLATTLG